MLEKAFKYAHTAVELDKKGQYEEALPYYKSAIDLMTKYIKLYPDSSMNELYRNLIAKYRERVEKLDRIIRSRVEGSESSKKQIDSDVEVIHCDGGSPKFDDLVDLDEVKKALKRAVIYPVKTPELYPLGWPRGILLFGPPGCGKTLISIALANEIRGALIHITPATIMSKWLGEAEKNVAKVFKVAREISNEKPVIIFIDEVDALFQEYSDEMGSEKRVRNQFLIEMDGLKSKSERSYVFIIGATNKPWKLDIGFIRRFDKRIYVPPPNVDVRKMIFQKYLSQLMGTYDIQNVNVDELAKVTEGYSSDDIYKIVKEVQSNLAEEYHENRSGKRAPTTEDFLEVIKRRKPSIESELIEAYNVWNEKYGAQ
ncbi:MAG: AAA family ATPase [Desulfurococcaceae archaeon]|uniref:AAA family ATPase n=1 Tax=Staphylothermus marinus TaxID=2280 RepID=A0A7C4NRR2_STAMA